MGTGSSKKLPVLENLVQSMTQSTKTLEILNKNCEQTVLHFVSKKEEARKAIQDQNEIMKSLQKQKQQFAQFASEFQPFLTNFQEDVAIINEDYDSIKPENNSEQLIDQRNPDQNLVEFNEFKDQFEIEIQKVQNQKSLFKTFKYNDKKMDQARLLQQYNSQIFQIQLLEDKIKSNLDKIRAFPRDLNNYEVQFSQKSDQYKILVQIEGRILTLQSKIFDGCLKKLNSLVSNFDQICEQQIQYQHSLNKKIENKKDKLNHFVIQVKKLQIEFDQESKNIISELIPQFQIQLIDLNSKLSQISSKKQLESLKQTKRKTTQEITCAQKQHLINEFQCEFSQVEKLVSYLKNANQETIKLQNQNATYQIYFDIKKLETQFNIKIQQSEYQFKQLIKKKEEYEEISIKESLISDQIQSFEIQKNAVFELISGAQQKYMSEQKNTLELQVNTLQLELLQLNQKYIEKENEVAQLYNEKEKYQQTLEELKNELDSYNLEIKKKEENEELQYYNNLEQIKCQQENMLNLKKKVEVQEQKVTDLQKTLSQSILKNNEIQKIINNFKSYVENLIFGSNKIQKYDKNEMQKLQQDLESLLKKFQANSDTINQLQATINLQQLELQQNQLKLEKITKLSICQQEVIKSQTMEIKNKDQTIKDLKERNDEEAKNKYKLLTDFEKERENLNGQIQKMKSDQELILKELKTLRDNDKNNNRNQKQRLCELQEKLSKLKLELEKTNELANQQDIEQKRLQLIEQAKLNFLEGQNQQFGEKYSNSAKFAYDMKRKQQQNDLDND